MPCCKPWEHFLLLRSKICHKVNFMPEQYPNGRDGVFLFQGDVRHLIRVTKGNPDVIQRDGGNIVEFPAQETPPEHIVDLLPPSHPRQSAGLSDNSNDAPKKWPLVHSMHKPYIPAFRTNAKTIPRKYHSLRQLRHTSVARASGVMCRKLSNNQLQWYYRPPGRQR